MEATSAHEDLNYGSFEAPLNELKTFLEQKENQGERILILIENVNGISVDEFYDAFKKAGLDNMLPKHRDAWLPETLNDPAHENARIFPVIGRSWVSSNSLSDDRFGFAKSMTVTGSGYQQESVANRLSNSNHPRKDYPMVAVLKQIGLIYFRSK